MDPVAFGRLLDPIYLAASYCLATNWAKMYGPVTYTDINTIIDAMLHYADQNGYPATHRMLQVETVYPMPFDTRVFTRVLKPNMIPFHLYGMHLRHVRR